MYWHGFAFKMHSRRAAIERFLALWELLKKRYNMCMLSLLFMWSISIARL